MATAEPRTRGRQAEAARNDRRVLQAARDVFTTQGFDAPVSAIAARAGVGMGSLYRRYGSKEELLQRLCVLAMEQTIEAAQSGLDAKDAWTGLAGYMRECVGFCSGAFAPIAGTISTTREMWDTSRRVRACHEKLVARAHAAGVLRRDVTALDISLLIEHFSRRGTPGPPEEADNARTRLLTITIDGLRAQHTTPLPGHPPTWDAYHSRWQPPPRHKDRE
jgi:AcrR family transcriptional regulator